MRPLSETRIAILKRLAGRNLDRDGAESAEEIRVAIGHPKKGGAHGPLREMDARGLVAPLGVTTTNATTWTITPAGREALAKASA